MLVTVAVVFLEFINLSAFKPAADLSRNKFIWISHFVSNDSLYNKGLESLRSKDTSKAERYFKASVIENDDAESHVELAKIYLRRNTYNSRNLAYDHLRTAELLKPKNISIKYFYADLCKDFARLSAFKQYNEIIAIDSSQIEAWINLGELKDQDFTEYNHSVRNMDEFYGSLQEYADQDFYEAEKYYKHALMLDSLNYSASLKLALLYEKAGLYDKGLPYLIRLEKNKTADKDIYLSLGLLHYKTRDFKDCLAEYKKALNLMKDSEREDFVFYSVKTLLQPILQDEMKNISDSELGEIIDRFWRISDPMYLTDYNERLLAHYSRVAFSNLHFSVPKMGIIGWKTDRGEIVLRYGEPLNLIRIRPQMGGNAVMAKTEVWNYADMTLGFSDPASSGNYQFTAPAGEKDKVIPQYAGDSRFYAEYLRKARFELYEPKFEGPNFTVPYIISQFKSLKQRNHTDVYVNYAIAPMDSLIKGGYYKDSHLAALFFFNNNEEKETDKRIIVDSLSAGSIIALPDAKKFYTNVLGASCLPDSGFYSFEILRDRDKGASVNRKNFRITRFNNFHLQMSSLLLASKIDKNKPDKFLINRGDYNILANPFNEFQKGEPLFIYYEVYNLQKGKNGLTDFDQHIGIREYAAAKETGLQKIIGSVVSFLGFGEKENVGFSSNYQSKDSNPQIFFQLDLSKAKTGKYVITISVTDKNANRTVTSEEVIDWTN